MTHMAHKDNPIVQNCVWEGIGELLLEQGEAWNMMVVLLFNLLINANTFSVMIAGYKSY